MPTFTQIRDAIAPGFGAVVMIERAELDALRAVVAASRDEVRALRQRVEAVEKPRNYLKAKAAAIYTGLSERTLARYREKGGGPMFVKCGSVVVYDTQDLDSWLDAKKVAHTAEAEARDQQIRAEMAREGLKVVR